VNTREKATKLAAFIRSFNHSIWRCSPSDYGTTRYVSLKPNSATPLAYPISIGQPERAMINQSSTDEPEEVYTMDDRGLVIYFTDDVTYLKWLDSYPDGYVLNMNWLVQDDQTLHRARCGHIQRRGSSLTTGASGKYGCLSESPLLQKARERSRQRPKFCSFCQPEPI
jgi:hypothetical protein